MPKIISNSLMCICSTIYSECNIIQFVLFTGKF